MSEKKNAFAWFFVEILWRTFCVNMVWNTLCKKWIWRGFFVNLVYKKFDKWKKTFKVSDGLVRYCEVGLNFALPETMKTISVPAEYADICFSNSGDGTQFFIYYYSREALLADLVLNMDCTVKDYADWFVSVNEYNNVDVKYDEENKTLTQKYIYEPENTFYCDYILRDDYSLIHVTMSCDAKIRDIYEPVFEEWIKEISIAEVEE